MLIAVRTQLSLGLSTYATYSSHFQEFTKFFVQLQIYGVCVSLTSDEVQRGAFTASQRC